MLLSSIVQKQRKEALLWTAILIVFAAFLTMYALHVQTLMLPNDLRKSWLGFSGWAFILDTANYSPILAITPRWLDAILVPLILSGFVRWCRIEYVQLPLVVGTYIVAFLVMGNPDNTYWGSMYTPLLPLGIIYTPGSTKKLALAAVGRTDQG